MGFLTDLMIWTGIFTAFTLTLLAPTQYALADNNDPDAMPSSAFSNHISDSAIVASEKSQRLNLLVDYVKKEGPGWMPGLPSFLRDPGGWALGNLKSAQHELSLGLGFNFGFGAEGIGDDGIMTSIVQPMSALMQPPPTEQAQAFWLSPNYHHKGFLPVNDAMIMGVNARHRIWGDQIQFDLHPYLGQNWHDADNYWGTELAIGLRAQPTGHEWGKIAIRYNNGTSAVMDNGRGFDMHADLNFNEHLSLTAGAQHNGDDIANNYAILKWQLATFGP